MVDGDRLAELAWGAGLTGICVTLGVTILWWWLPSRAVSLFGPRIDPGRRLQLGYGLLCMAMAGTNAGCRFIPHPHLAAVHEAFAAITALLAIALGPRLLALARAGRRAAVRPAQGPRPPHGVETPA